VTLASHQDAIALTHRVSIRGLARRLTPRSPIWLTVATRCLVSDVMFLLDYTTPDRCWTGFVASPDGFGWVICGSCAEDITQMAWVASTRSGDGAVTASGCSSGALGQACVEDEHDEERLVLRAHPSGSRVSARRRRGDVQV
jgi:hypothetical protein